MTWTALPLKDAYVFDIDLKTDERGFFGRTWCQKGFEKLGLEIPNWVQSNISFNKTKGTLRGMHFQQAPFEEPKLVCCTAGAVFDVIVDLRPNSPTYRHWHGVELSAKAPKSLYVPKGFAHGFQTLEDNSQLWYQMGEYYVPEASQGVRWDDPALNISWPLPNPILSERDQSYPLLEAIEGRAVTPVSRF